MFTGGSTGSEGVVVCVQKACETLVKRLSGVRETLEAKAEEEKKKASEEKKEAPSGVSTVHPCRYCALCCE